MSPNDRPLRQFGVELEFADDLCVVAVRGEIDLVTAPQLRGAVEAVAAQGYARVVLDLAQVGFIGAAGVSIIAGAAERLGTSGGQMVVRGPSILFRRLLDLFGFADVVEIDPPDPDLDHLGPEQARRAIGPAVTLPTPHRAQDLGRAMTVPADNDVIDGALRMVVALAQATIRGADGVSVSLQRHGRLSTVAASDQTILEMDADQYATGEGPCVDASMEGRWFHAESLDGERRWPAFVPRARQLGISAILSTPLLSHQRPVGALNIYSRTAKVYAAHEQEMAAMFATRASAVLQDAGVDVSESALSRRLAEALRSRQVIAQAQGVFMALDGVDEVEAFAIMRSSAHKTNTPLYEFAEHMVKQTRGRHG